MKEESKFICKRVFWVSILGVICSQLFSGSAFAQGASFPSINIGLTEANDPTEVVTIIKVLALLTVLTMAPAILLMMTSFTRLVIVLSFVRHALGTQAMPPNQVLVGLSMFLTFFIMSPVLSKINDNALQPFLQKKITQTEALKRLEQPVRSWMLKQTKEAELSLLLTIGKMKKPKSIGDVPTYLLIPAFILSELKTAFLIGFLIYVPFLIIDMVVSSVLMAMGMLMLPPTVVSLPFKLILFVLIDGWELIVGSLVKSFG